MQLLNAVHKYLSLNSDYNDQSAVHSCSVSGQLPKVCDNSATVNTSSMLAVKLLGSYLIHTIHVFKNDAALRKPFPLLRRDCAANTVPVCINAATEVLNAAPEDTNTAHKKP